VPDPFTGSHQPHRTRQETYNFGPSPSAACFCCFLALILRPASDQGRTSLSHPDFFMCAWRLSLHSNQFFSPLLFFKSILLCRPGKALPANASEALCSGLLAGDSTCHLRRRLFGSCVRWRVFRLFGIWFNAVSFPKFSVFLAEMIFLGDSGPFFLRALSYSSSIRPLFFDFRPFFAKSRPGAPPSGSHSLRARSSALGLFPFFLFSFMPRGLHFLGIREDLLSFLEKVCPLFAPINGNSPAY